MKLNWGKTLFLILCIIGCSDSDLTITNSQENISSNIVGLKSLNSGINQTYVNLSWNIFENANYVLSVNEIVVDTPHSNNYTLTGMNPGQVDKIVLFVYFEELILKDSIIVFTSSLESVTNYIASPSYTSNGYKYYELSWNNNADIVTNILYRATIQTNAYPTFSLDENGFINSQWDSLTTFNNLESSYSDTVFTPDFYYYILKNINENNNYRYSFIPNINFPIQNSTFEFINISDNLFNRIELSWNPYTNSDFYEMELWRSNDSNSLIDESTLLGVFSDSTIDYFYDVTELTGGIEYYYQMKITNIYGYSLASETISGRSHP